MSIQRLFDSPLKVINVGLQSFAQDLRTVGVECRHVALDPARPQSDDDRSDGDAAGSGRE